MDMLHRIVSNTPITARELRLSGLFVLVWFFMDAIWFLGTVMGWY